MKRGRLYRILAVAILLSLLLIVIPATPVLAAPILSISPASGAVGTKVTVTGENFDSYKGDDIYLFFDNQEIAINPIIVPQTGSFSFNFDIPAGAEPGQHQIGAESELRSTLALSVFTVLNAAISLDSKAGVVGTTLTINGQGFYANRMLSFYYDNRLLNSEAAGGIGEFSYSFTIPDGTAGKHKFAAKNVEGHYAEGEFEVLPSITLDATSAATGNILAVNGSGFGSGSIIDVYFRHDEVAYAKTNEFGSFKVTLFKVPGIAPGTYDVTAIDKDGHKGGATFTIIAEAIADTTAEDKLDAATPPNWGTYTLIGVGALVIGILAFWLGRKTTYH